MQICHYSVSAEYSVEIFGRILCRNSFRSVSKKHHLHVMCNKPFSVAVRERPLLPEHYCISIQYVIHSSAQCLIKSYWANQWTFKRVEWIFKGGNEGCKNYCRFLFEFLRYKSVVVRRGVILVRGYPYMTSALRGGRGVSPKEDVVREVA